MLIIYNDDCIQIKSWKQARDKAGESLNLAKYYSKFSLDRCLMF